MCNDIHGGNAAARAIAAQLLAYRTSRSNLPLTEEHATTKLLSKALDPADIARRRAAFLTNGSIDGTAVLANYELLHGLVYIDQLAHPTEASIEARAVASLFRGAEVCLLNLTEMARQVACSAAEGRWGQAFVATTWMNHFTDTLYRLGQLLVRIDRGAADGEYLCIRNSPAFAEYSQALQSMHHVLSHVAPESIADIAANDIDDSRRFVFFHCYVNTNYEALWKSMLERVRIPGFRRSEAEDAQTFFERIVQCALVKDAVTCVDLSTETYLMQFRAYHQISEILVALVNNVLGDVSLTLVDATQTDLEPAARAAALCNSLLQVVTDNIKPIVRTLSPHSYLAIRPALGITSGSHSHNLRKGLFLTIYPLLVRALRLRLAAFDETAAADDAQILDSAREVLRGPDDGLAGLVRNVVYVYQAVRTWRDEHIQFVKTQIGVSASDMTPTASISGSENAAQTAQGFRRVHAADPIGPLYEALLGKRAPEVLPLVHPGEFDEFMGCLTATAVQSMYADVQARVQRKRSATPSPPS
jgi:tryptophan 2,3-dioxygenase